jgi:orotate phosphoribosyltransferase
VVTLVEDVVVSGSRATRAIEQLRAEGAVVTAVICVIDGMAGATDVLPDVDYQALFTVEDLGLPKDLFRIS